MYNNLINTEAQDFSNERNTPIRVCNENNINLFNNKWKVLDYRKVVMKVSQVAINNQLQTWRPVNQLSYLPGGKSNRRIF